MKAITEYPSEDLTFSMRVNYFQSVRRPEDGEFMEGAAVVVQAQSPDGYRWVRPVGARDYRLEEDEDTGEMMPVPTASLHRLEALALEMVEKLNGIRCPKLNPDVWYYNGACYGSDAYTETEDSRWNYYAD